MQTALWFTTFGLSLVVLTHFAKLFVKSAEEFAKAMSWSSFFVGLTILALGNTLPELGTSIWATVTNKSSIVAATVVGANITNGLLILGASAIAAKTLPMGSDGIRQQMGLFLISSILLAVTLYDGQFVWTEGLLMLTGFLAYSLFSYEEHKAGRLEAFKNWVLGRELTGRMVFLLLATALVTTAASYLSIYALEQVASRANILPSLIGASVLALGTSLPELTTAWIAIKQKNSEMAVGTLIGSSVLNATVVMAVPSFFRPLNVSSDLLIIGLPFLLISTALLLFAVSQRKLHAYEGILFLVLYILFIQQLFSSF